MTKFGIVTHEKVAAF